MNEKNKGVPLITQRVSSEVKPPQNLWQPPVEVCHRQETISKEQLSKILECGRNHQFIDATGVECKPEELSSLSPAAQQAAYELANARCLPETRRNANLDLLLAELLEWGAPFDVAGAELNPAPRKVDQNEE